MIRHEPTGNLDGDTGAVVMGLLFEMLARHGATLMPLTHDAALAARSGPGVHLADGRIVGDEGE